MWAYTLLLPTILRSLPAEYHTFRNFLHSGPLGINWLRPEALLGFESFADSWGDLGTGSKYYFIFGFPEFIVQVWQNKFRQKVSYYETKPLPAQHTSTDMTYFITMLHV
jgi:hypothetical protein